MDFEILLLVLFLGALILVSPVLGVIVLVRQLRSEKRQRDRFVEFDSRLRALRRRLDQLGRALERMPARMPADVESPPVDDGPPEPAAAKVAPSAPTPPSSPAPVPRTGLDLESMIAGRWLNRIGIVALLLAVGFFLKYAFDNEWIGAAGRVAIGLVCGAGLLVYSQWLLGRGYRYFSEGIAATGAGSLYLSLYAAWGFYELVPQAAAFAGMIVVTASMVALAVGRDSQRLALLALLGGLMTPGVLSTGEDSQLVLFAYLAVLDGGLILLARARPWRVLEPVALVGTLVYAVGWYDSFYEAAKLARTLAFASLFFVEFAALPIVRARRQHVLRPEQYALVLLNVTWFLVALHVLLYDDHRWALTLTVLVLAALHIAVVRTLPAAQQGRLPAVRVLYAGLALTLVTIAIPIRLEGEWITMAWAIEGAVLVWSGFRTRTRMMRIAGLVLFVPVLFLLLVQETDASRVLFNARFATFAVAIAAFSAAFLLARSYKGRLASGEPKIFAVVAGATNLLGAWALSLEVWDFFGQVRFGVDGELAQHMGLSVFWAAYATVSIVVGVSRGAPLLRWMGLALLGLAILKVFLIDLSFLERAYRILSFFALGLVLLVVSFLYQRKLFGGREGNGS